VGSKIVEQQPSEYLARVRVALRARGFELTEEHIGGRRSDAARRSDFRWRWFAVRLHTAVIVATFDAEEARRPDLDRFLEAASQWAVEHRRGSRSLGLQSGTAAVAVAVLPGGSGDGPDWAAKPHGRRFAALAYPVAVDLMEGRVVEPGRMVIGGMFSGFLRGVVRDVLRAPLRDDDDGPGG
jgi:hypothetical protein